jgi:large subunit ribosomal protein L17
MQKRKEGRTFGRTRGQRNALLRGLMADLIEHEKISTTLAKAKELKRIIDRVVILAKKSHQPELSVASIRRLQVILPEKSVQKFRNEAFIKRFEDRTSGFTRVIKLDPRKSDSAELALIEFV